jgi:hypothetical protein
MSTALDDAVLELMTLPASDKRRYTSKLSRAIAMAPPHAFLLCHILQEQRRPMDVFGWSTDTQAEWRDERLWNAFELLCGQRVPDMLDLLHNVLARDPATYLIPPARAWLQEQDKRVQNQ